MCMCDYGNSVSCEKAIFVQQNLGIWGLMGSKFRVEIVIFGIADPDLPIHYATFKGSLLLSAPIVKHFQAKKTKSSVFSAKI